VPCGLSLPSPVSTKRFAVETSAVPVPGVMLVGAVNISACDEEARAKSSIRTNARAAYDATLRNIAHLKFKRFSEALALISSPGISRVKQ
jgi:hypothetical protein